MGEKRDGLIAAVSLMLVAGIWIYLLIQASPPPAPMFTGHGSRYANPTDPGMQCSARWFEWVNHTAAWGVTPGIRGWIEQSKIKYPGGR